MSEYLNNVFGGIAVIQDEGYQLVRLADAFLMTGNKAMSEELRLIASNIAAAGTQIRQAVGKEIDDELKESQAAFGRTLNALLSQLQQGE